MLEFVIPCLLGLESLVGDEIKKLGLSDVRVENGRVLCHGEARDIARLNINLAATTSARHTDFFDTFFKYFSASNKSATTRSYTSDTELR